MYRDGGFVYEDLIVSNYPDFKMYLCNKIIPGDFDNDGDVDMFLSGTGPDVAPLIGEQSYILENNYSTDGTFFAHPVGPSDGYLHHSATGDLDNDGDLDIMLSETQILKTLITQIIITILMELVLVTYLHQLII
jgi:hypothetical protein